jgi:hypothetical protein
MTGPAGDVNLTSSIIWRAFTFAGLVSSERSASWQKLQLPWFSTPSAAGKVCI